MVFERKIAVTGIKKNMSLEKNKPFIVAIDGPAGGGKSSVCAELCAQENWGYINTGALYRAIAYLAGMNNAELSDNQKLDRVVKDFVNNFRWDSKSSTLYYDGTSISEFLHTEEAGAKASAVAKIESVRKALIPVQRHLIFSSLKPVVLADGRDIGTVIVPDADLKVFLTANLKTRALRRFTQLEPSLINAEESNVTIDELNHKNKTDLTVEISPEESQLQVIMHDIALRDEQDEKRGVAPLSIAPDAILVDTSDMSLAQAVAKVKELIFRKHRAKA